MDLATIAAGAAALKTGFEALRIARDLVKDALGQLPAGERKDSAARTLEEADRQVRLGEAQIAQALGYPLCRCAFPPTPMLLVGRHERTLFVGDEYLVRPDQPEGVPKGAKVYGPTVPVHECPRCGQNDAGRWVWERTASPRAEGGQEGPGA